MQEDNSMKKTIMLLGTAALLAIALTACDSKTTTKTTTPTEAPAQATEQPAATEQPTAEATEQPAAEATEDAGQ